jgi:hypothetical protein
VIVIATMPARNAHELQHRRKVPQSGASGTAKAPNPIYRIEPTHEA